MAILTINSTFMVFDCNLHLLIICLKCKNRIFNPKLHSLKHVKYELVIFQSLFIYQFILKQLYPLPLPMLISKYPQISSILLLLLLFQILFFTLLIILLILLLLHKMDLYSFSYLLFLLNYSLLLFQLYNLLLVLLGLILSFINNK